jgi:hypothetical protein
VVARKIPNKTAAVASEITRLRFMTSSKPARASALALRH